MAWWRAVGRELSALGTLALSMPLDLLLPHEPFDPTAPQPTPVIFVHGLCGAASNFLVLRTFFAAHDALVPPPADTSSRVMVIEDCGHLNLLRHPAVLRAVARYLCTAAAPIPSMACEAA